MMTPDKDYGQLVTDHVFMYRPKYGDKEFEVMGVEQVKAKFDIQSPAQVIDMLGLMGDSSDNIPGCPGVGEKTAQKLIAEFGSIENLLEHTDQLKGALKTKVETNREMIIFSKFLATIKVDVPIRLDMNSLVREQADEDTLRKIFEELEFRTLMERIFKKESSPASPIAGTLFNQENGPVQGNLFEEFTPDHTNEEKKSNLESLNSLSYDYQLIDTEEKRNEIIKMDKAGQYIPFCTRMVFLKYYTPSADNQLHFWGHADRVAYVDAMNTVLVNYLEEPIVLEKEEE